ncbi:serine protease Hayan-like [Anopheles cruzii]|uniref:serine protease Hayan-like n=1 Tax=Anopheles cruzii TaxID=68878 RepID=UPI0022EC21A9|nr:serine protease Hayan-like [Anopheles cruzii]XP_052872639.1 serine protease Hayan-like [Anopheles cruzii]
MMRGHVVVVCWVSVVLGQQLAQVVQALLDPDLIILQPDPMLYEGDACQLRNGTAGTCRPADQCDWAMAKPWLTSELVTCSFNQSMPIVCCVRQQLESRIITKRISETQCERYPNATGLSDHIFNGVAAQFGEFPHMAALGYGRPPDSGGTANDSYGAASVFRCAASLVAPRFLLTAAHCLREQPTFARLGVLELQPARVVDEPLDIAVRNVTLHPEYNAVTYRNDLAVVELATPASGWPFVDPACLYTKPSAALTATDSPLSVQGWGTVQPGDTEPSPRLMKAHLQVLGRDVCASGIPRSRRNPAGLHDGQLCALGRNERNETVADTCPGDSGAPLELVVAGRHYLVGVTSNGYACGSPIPGLYTEVAHYLDWIESIVWPASGTR